MTRFLVVAVVACNLMACADDDPAPVFPANYLDTYVEVRDCRQSGEHDLNRIRVLADPAAADAYQLRDRLFPLGSVVLKEEYDFADPDCTGPIKQWTVMQRISDSPDTLDWYWQRVDAERNLLGENTPACYGCHSLCTPAAGGYEFTCTVP